MDQESVKVDEDEDEIEDETNNDSIASEQDNDNDTIEQQPYIPNQLSNGEMMCGSVIINDSDTNNNISIKQYTSMINEEMNTLLKQSHLYTDATEININDTLTDNLKMIHDKVKKLNKVIQNNNNSEK